jgi:hypothetical protein
VTVGNLKQSKGRCKLDKYKTVSINGYIITETVNGIMIAKIGYPVLDVTVLTDTVIITNKAIAAKSK